MVSSRKITKKRPRTRSTARPKALTLSCSWPNVPPTGLYPSYGLAVKVMDGSDSESRLAAEVAV